MICPNCQSEVSKSKFCPECGFALDDIYEESISAEPELDSETDYLSDEYISDSEVPNNSRKMVIILGISILIMAFILFISIFPNSIKTKDFRNAIECKDPDAIYYIYMDADYKLKGKYNKIVDDTIDKMANELKNHDFYDEALNDSEAIDDWISDNWDGLYWGTVDYDHNFEDIFNQSNTAKWEKLEQIIDETERYCLGVNEYASDKDYLSAINALIGVDTSSYIYEKVYILLDNSVEAYKQQCITTADDYISKDDVPKAIEFLSGAIESLDERGLDSNSLTEKINQIKSEYAEKYANEAKSEFSKGNVDSAIGKMKVANEYQPENAEYSAKIKEYEQYKPFELYKEENALTIEWNNSAGGLVFENENVEANNGKTYSHYMRIYHDDYDNGEEYLVDVTYNLAGKYDTVTGIILVGQENKSDNQEGYFEAYGDGKLIYTSPKVGPGILPQNISFSVKNVQRLEIKFLGTTDIGWGTTYYVSDLTAKKTVK